LWGNAAPIETSAAQAMLDALERAWSTELDTMGYPAPAGTEDWLLDVYVANTGDGAPELDAVLSGFASYDDGGFPIIVVGRDVVVEGGNFAEDVCAHEFFHTVQGSTERFPYEGLSAWLWEATAVWMEYQVFPEHSEYASDLFGYSYLPHYPLAAFDLLDAGTLPEYHQYGAFILPHYLSQLVVDPSLVRDVWLDAGDEPDPLVVIGTQLATAGYDFHEVWLDHLAHDVTWDYPDHDNLRAWARRYDDEWRESSNVIIGEVSAAGTDGFVVAPAQTLPRRFGSNAWRMVWPESGRLRVQVHGVVHGDADQVPAHWGARIVREFPDRVEYVAVPFQLGEDWQADLWLESVGDERAIWLVVGVWTDDPAPAAWATESFAYELAMTPDHAEPDDSGDEGLLASSSSDEGEADTSTGPGVIAFDDGCGCRTAPRREPARGTCGPLMLALLCSSVRRRTSRQRGASSISVMRISPANKPVARK
jgi:hypothetical protein